MNLQEYQRTFVSLCFDAEPSAAALSALGGDSVRWSVYRQMVRARLHNMARVAFARSERVLGEEALASSHARFLAAGGPRSRFIREVVADFGRFALDDDVLRPGAYARDLLRFELDKWELAYAPMPPAEEVVDVDFERPVVLNPLLRLRCLEHPVHREENDGPQPCATTRLLMYRPPAQSGVRWWPQEAFGAALFQWLLEGADSLADAVRGAAASCELALDQALLERLSGVLALAVERGVLLGSRA